MITNIHQSTTVVESNDNMTDEEKQLNNLILKLNNELEIENNKIKSNLNIRRLIPKYNNIESKNSQNTLNKINISQIIIDKKNQLLEYKKQLIEIEKLKEIEKKNKELLEQENAQKQLDKLKFEEINKVKNEQRILYKRYLLSKSTRK